MAAAQALVLFDIDGTLLRRAGPHHRQALTDAILEVSGVRTSFDGIETSGRLDRDLIRTLLRNADAAETEIDRWMPLIVERAQAGYQLLCPGLEDKVCPGVREFLGTLQTANIPAGLVTGNLTAIGWKKMEAAGLRTFFTLGAFADMASTRADLVDIAIRSARECGIAGEGTVIWLVGDHPNDVLAAKLNGIRSIAVATGISTREELAECNPTIVVSDLRDLKLESLL